LAAPEGAFLAGMPCRLLEQEQRMTAAMVPQANAAATRETPAKLARRIRNRLILRPVTRAAIGLGVLSGGLYFLLYTFSGDIRQIAEMTNRGDRTYFLLPIGIAFLFSAVHGLFTDRFWEALGLKAKRSTMGLKAKR